MACLARALGALLLVILLLPWSAPPRAQTTDTHEPPVKGSFGLDVRFRDETLRNALDFDTNAESGPASDSHYYRLRVRAFPFPDSVKAFIEQHEQVFVVEQNRDAQLRSMLVNELQVDPARLVPILHYDGTPITARFIAQAITRQVHVLAVTPRKEKVR